MATAVVESKLGKSLDDLIKDMRKQGPKKTPGKQGAKGAKQDKGSAQKAALKVTQKALKRWAARGACAKKLAAAAFMQRAARARAGHEATLLLAAHAACLPCVTPVHGRPHRMCPGLGPLCP